jgi:Ser/Thr protein kinase RdoA (MazF antagonist)
MERIAQGREAEVFDRGDGTVLKLFRAGIDRSRAGVEAAALAAVAASGVDAPQVVEQVTVDGRTGLVLGRVEGTDLLSILERRPLLVLAVGRALATAQAAMHRVAAPAALPDLHELLAARIAAATPLDATAQRRALDELAALPAGDRLLHGDLHPGNLLGSVAAPIIIDCGDAARGDPLADVARTELLLRVGHLPPGTPPLLRALSRVGRGLLLGAYRRAYGPVDRAAIARWRRVRAAARLSEGVDDAEVPVLLRLAASRDGVR